MKNPVQAASVPVCVQPNSPEWRFVARQPILDRLGRVHAYHLLSRIGDADAFHGNTDLSTQLMIDQAAVFGTDLFSDNRLAFIPCTLKTLTSGAVSVLPPHRTVLHLEERALPSQQLNECLTALRSQGFKISLGSYCIDPDYQPLAALADYVKVDFSRLNRRDLGNLRQRLIEGSAALVAEKIETQSEYRDACAEGIGLFQGFYFCRPEPVKMPQVPMNMRALLKIMELLHQEPADLKKAALWVQQDTSLLYRLLRLVNSPLYAVRQEIRSVDAAIMMVGAEKFRKIVTLALIGGINTGGSEELLRMSYTRARFAELAAAVCAQNPDEQYLVGMLSMLPAMLKVPMKKLVLELPFREEVRAALCDAGNAEGLLLRWMQAHERADWAAENALECAAGLEHEKLLSAYFSAVQWAEEMLHFAL